MANAPFTPDGKWVPPRPWRVRKNERGEPAYNEWEYAVIEDAEGREIGRMGPPHRATCELIVAAVNRFAALADRDE